MGRNDPSVFDDLLREEREFPPTDAFRNGRRHPGQGGVRFGGEGSREVLGERGESPALVLAMDQGPRLEPSRTQGGSWAATTNISYNCLDRHLQGPRRNKAALIWEGENGEIRTLTYLQLHREVCKFANCLKDLGVTKGDRVAIYMPLLLETAVTMLACARIGAIHNVVFGGFSSDALADRINDSGCKVLVTADGGWRRGTVVPLKHNADRALESCPSVEHVIIVKNLPGEPHLLHITEGRDRWYHRMMDHQKADCPAEPMDAEDTLFILYTSGTTGKPKGIVHATGGYMVGVHTTSRTVFDLRDEDVFWCTADVGWVTGHSYVVYGPLLAGATVMLYEGAPDFPEKDRFWEIIERHRVSVFYTAPTSIRSFMKWGDDLPARHDLSSVRLLGSVGEPINPEAWMWYHAHIGGDRCPIVDTWWQTETGAIMISGLPGVSTMKPGLCRHAPARDLRHDTRRIRQGGERGKRPAGHHPSVAVDAADCLGRRRTLREDLLLPVGHEDVFPRRRGQARPCRELHDPGARG